VQYLHGKLQNLHGKLQNLHGKLQNLHPLRPQTMQNLHPFRGIKRSGGAKNGRF
jgi:hypothetical protein